MANITSEHLHHMARRHHATMQKLNELTGKFSGITKRARSTGGMAAGAWFGGALEGKTDGKTLGPVPLNLGIGVILLAASYIPAVEKSGFSEDLSNVGSGFVASYLAATGYAFGKRWNETGKMFGGGAGRPWTHPYENGWPKHPLAAMAPPTAGQWPPGNGQYPDQSSVPLTPEQMVTLAQRMTAAAQSPSS